MARLITPLTEASIKRLKYNNQKPNKHFDGNGLFLEVRPTGLKKWRVDYTRTDGKRSLITLGDYPAISLQQARLKRDEIKAQVSEGLNPVIERILKKEELKLVAVNTFAAITEEFLDFKKNSWSYEHYIRMKNGVANNAYQFIGQTPINKITGKSILDIIRRIEARGALEMASRVFDCISMVFRYAVATGRTEVDVTYGLNQFLADKPPVQHRPHVGEENIPELLHAMENYVGRYETTCALYLMTRTFPRTAELVSAQWEEFDLDNAYWRIPSKRMKGRLMMKLYGPDHIVPLSEQVVAMLRRLKEVNGRFKFLFPGMKNPRTSPMSLETMNKALHRLGFKDEQTVHGLRGLCSTMANESGLFRREVIDTQLSHKNSDKVEIAYNHAKYWDERKELMQWWSDYLDFRYFEGIK